MPVMKQVLGFSDSNIDIHQLGGKGASLVEMHNLGMNVPTGFIILSSAFDKILSETHLDKQIKSQISALNTDNMENILKVSVSIRSLISEYRISDDLRNEIQNEFKKLGADFVAVRSSATTEDSAVASWAGELDTFLNVDEQNLITKIKDCWSSLFTPRAIPYRYQKGMLDKYIGVAVVVQEMIQSEVSGIAFTVHPVTKDHHQMVIEAVYGLGEAIVSGQITPDTYVVAKSDGLIISKNISTQKIKLIKSNQNKNSDITNIWINLKDESQLQKLNDKQIILFAKEFIKIENHFKFPCDIEWAMENEKLYITQSRPITTLSG